MLQIPILRESHMVTCLIDAYLETIVSETKFETTVGGLFRHSMLMYIKRRMIVVIRVTNVSNDIYR